MTPRRIILYSVPDLKKVAGGPASRIKAFSEAILKQSQNSIIVSSGITKILKSLFSKPADILYIESSTNRLKLVDFFSIFFLTLKCKTKIIYIRDLYFEMIPDEFKGNADKIRKILNRLSYKILNSIATVMAFPTIQMADKFYEFHNNFKKRMIIDLPPGISDYHVKPFQKITKGNRINIAYMGATKYKYSGFIEYINIADKASPDLKFFILSKDALQRDQFKNIEIHNISQSHLKEFISAKKIHFLLHSRPRNNYDDLTYPIKIMDSISMNLPVVTLSHLPLVKLFGKDYPLFLNDISSNELERLIEKILNDYSIYEKVESLYSNIAKEYSYQNLVSKLIQCG